MAPQTQVKVFESGTALFGGISLRRISVSVGGQGQQLLLHEQPAGSAHEQAGVTPFLLDAREMSGRAALPLQLVAEWGEPLGEVVALQATSQTGELTGYTLRLRHRDGSHTELQVDAGGTYWWNNELYARKRLSYTLRDIQRGKRARARAQAA